MGKLPIISRRGIRDNEFVSAACSVGCGATAGTACGCAAATAGTTSSSACTSSASADIVTAPRSSSHGREDSKLRETTIDFPSQRYRRLRRSETSEFRSRRRRRSRCGAVYDAEKSNSSNNAVASDIDQGEKRERVASGSERLSTATPRTGTRLSLKGLQCEVTDIDSGSSNKRAKGLVYTDTACSSIADSTAVRGTIEPKRCPLPRTTAVVDSISVTVLDSKRPQEFQCKLDVIDRIDSTVSREKQSAVAISITDAGIVTGVPQEARRHRDHPRFSSTSSGIGASSTYRGAVPRALLLGLLFMSLMCDPIIGVPADRRRMDLLEDPFEQQDDLATTKNTLDESELEIIRRSMQEALGLQRIPDPSKANVSQAEYERAHREYLKKVQLSHNGPEPRKRRSLHIFHATDHPGNRSTSSAEADEEAVGHRHALFFPVEIPDEDGAVDHAALRLLLEGHHRHYGDVEVLLYLTTDDESRRLIDRHRIRLDDPRDTRWIELDSTKAASSWHDYGDNNLGIELEFLHDGVPVRRTFSSPALNVFTTSHDEDGFVGRRRKRAALDPLKPLHVGRRTECRGDKKCCRHEMTVIFKDLKGFDFIVQPKFFDAGYCKGRCPPRYNPAHHHALLQSLIWKEDRSKAPKPCCAPSKLTEVEIVYYDENNPEKLKVSNWKNLRAEECACS